MSVISILACSFLDSFLIYSGLAFVIGCAQGGVALAIYVMVSEFVGSKYKSMTSGAGKGLLYTISLCLLSLQAWLIQEWRIT